MPRCLAGSFHLPPSTSRLAMRSRASRRAFTLIEALLALTLTGVLAAGCITLLMETAKARAELETTPLLARHVRGLGTFLEDGVRRTLTATKAAGLFSSPPDARTGTKPALYLKLDDMDELPVTGETRPRGEGWLSFEQDTGLVLNWRTELQAKADGEHTSRTVLSSYVTEWNLMEYDPQRDMWGVFDPARPDLAPGLRRRLILKLRRFGETAELAINLDAPPAHAPAY